MRHTLVDEGVSADNRRRTKKPFVPGEIIVEHGGNGTDGWDLTLSTEARGELPPVAAAIVT